MRQHARWALGAAVLALAVSAAAGPPAAGPRKGGRLGGAEVELDDEAVQVIVSRFDHGKHEKVFTDQAIPCLACHPMNAKLAEGLKWDEPTSHAALRPDSLSCHYCHNVDEGRELGPGRCLLCHQPEQVEPDESHGAWWHTDHATAARDGYRGCLECHRDYTCVECHEKKDPVRWKVHDGTWRSTHSIDARIMPGRCETCHLGADCLECHATRGGRL